MKDWVGALSTIPREHPGVNNLVLAYICSLYICILIYRLSAVRCVVRFMKDWVGALSTIPREHPGVNNLVLAYTCSLYICIFIYRLSAVRCTIMLVWAGLLVNNLCLYMQFIYMYFYISTERRWLYDYAGLGRVLYID